jgi:anti-anti-sigma regulatory factor
MSTACGSPVELSSEKGVTLLRLGEGADIRCVQRLLAMAREAVAIGQPISVCCEQVTFLDTPVLQVLLALRRACLDRHIPFEIQGISESMHKHLTLAGLAKELLGTC